MKLRVVLIALGLAAVTAGGALADGGPGPGPGGPPLPPGGQQQPGGDVDDGGADPEKGQGPAQQPPRPAPGRPAKNLPAAEKTFRDALKAAGYTCAPRPVILRGSLATVAADSITLKRPAARPQDKNGNAAPTRTAPAQLTVKLLPATVVRRKGPAGASALTVGDRAVVNAAVCRTAGQANTTVPALVARIVDAHPARAG